MINPGILSKLQVARRYFNNILGGLVALPIALIISTLVIVVAVCALPFVWGFITLVWYNSFKHKLNNPITPE